MPIVVAANTAEMHVTHCFEEMIRARQNRTERIHSVEPREDGPVTRNACPPRCSAYRLGRKGGRPAVTKRQRRNQLPAHRMNTFQENKPRKNVEGAAFNEG